MYFLALQQLSISKNWDQSAKIFNEELVHLHRGQGMDLFWRDTFTIPTEADYLKMISNKTGGLFRLALRLMQAEATEEVNLMPLIETFGLIFQIRDDYENLCSEEVCNGSTLQDQIGIKSLMEML
jgi:geranylgeranyl diphosphate synthase, type III